MNKPVLTKIPLIVIGIFIGMLLLPNKLSAQPYIVGLEIEDMDLFLKGRINIGDENGSIFIGKDVGLVPTLFGNVRIGDSAGGTGAGDNNTIIGFRAGVQLNSLMGAGNVLMGANSGTSLKEGGLNVFIGNSAGGVMQGNYNVAIGNSSGSGSGGPELGNNNIYIGYMAGKQINGSTSNRLVIDSNEGPPLIYGEFDNEVVEINGTLKIRDVLNLSSKNSEPVDPEDGDLYLDDGSNTVNGSPGLRWYNGLNWIDL